MNSKVIIGIIVVLVILGGGYYAWHKHSETQSSTATQNMNMPTQSQSQKSSAGSTSQPKTTDAVTIQNFAFSPATITVKAGQSVTWTNEDSVGHSATADDNSWDTGVLSQGQSKAITFAKAGTYTYHCSVHPNMKATVIVQ